MRGGLPRRLHPLRGGRRPLLYIDPNECIDCGACEPECPVNAIFPEESVPAEWAATRSSTPSGSSTGPPRARWSRSQARGLNPPAPPGMSRVGPTGRPSPLSANDRAEPESRSPAGRSVPSGVRQGEQTSPDEARPASHTRDLFAARDATDPGPAAGWGATARSAAAARLRTMRIVSLLAVGHEIVLPSGSAGSWSACQHELRLSAWKRATERAVTRPTDPLSSRRSRHVHRLATEALEAGTPLVRARRGRAAASPARPRPDPVTPAARLRVSASSARGHGPPHRG